jgi:hypothetical protein
MGQQQSTPSIPTTPAVEVPKVIDSNIPPAGCPVKAKTEGTGECANCANKATEQPAKSECPMRAKQDNVATQAAVEQPISACPMKGKSTTTAAPATGGGCPMKSKQEPAKVESSSAAPTTATQAQPAAAPVSECPVRTKNDKYVNPNVYNVREFCFALLDYDYLKLSCRSTIKRLTQPTRCQQLLISYLLLIKVWIYLRNASPPLFQKVELILLGYIHLLKWLVIIILVCVELKLILFYTLVLERVGS